MDHAPPSPPSDASPGDGRIVHVVVMGVSGCGKSTVGALLAQALHCEFVEGDALHPAHNVEKMAAGQPLTDEDRAGWLRSIAARLADAHAQRRSLVVSCSALKRRYRDVLRSGAPGLRFVFLHGEPALLAQRMALRTGHYMPPSLLDSQLATLEPPGPDEHAIALEFSLPPQELAARAADVLGIGAAAAATLDVSASSAAARNAR